MSVRNPKTVVICKELKVESFTTSVKSLGVFERIFTKISDKHDVPVNEIRKAVMSVFKFTSILLSRSVSKPYNRDNLIKVRWIFFGTFQISKYRVNNFFKKYKGV